MSAAVLQTITKLFTTCDPTTGAAADADSLPTGTLYVDGVADSATVTVTNITTAVYKAVVTLPDAAAAYCADLRIAATVGTVAGEEVIWSDVVDLKLVSDLNDLAAGAAMTLTGAYQATLTAAIEAALLNEGDATALLQAIADKISSDWTAGDLSAVAIASAVRTNLATELARIDADISSRLASTSYTAPDNAGVSAVQAKTDQLTFTDGTVDANATASVDAQAIRDALGMLLANLDEQLAEILGAAGGTVAGWVSITQSTLDDSGVALGVTEVSGVVTAGVTVSAIIDGVAKYNTTSDGDGEYDLPVPPGATYTVRFSWDGPDGAASTDKVVTI